MKRAKFEKSAASEFSRIAKEEMTAEVIGGTVYGFGSELATLRCYKAYEGTKGLHQAFSTPRNSWYFSFDLQYVTIED